ncbi:MAG TPA: hypothetical protein VFZ02_10895 [Ktedonobacteraceae bacterium]
MLTLLAQRGILSRHISTIQSVRHHNNRGGVHRGSTQRFWLTWVW